MRRLMRYTSCSYFPAAEQLMQNLPLSKGRRRWCRSRSSLKVTVIWLWPQRDNRRGRRVSCPKGSQVWRV